MDPARNAHRNFGPRSRSLHAYRSWSGEDAPQSAVPLALSQPELIKFVVDVVESRLSVRHFLP
jgi:hypothetical protein